MEKGIIQAKEPLLQSIVEKPNRILFEQPSQYQDIFSKAAVMMEAITRWHVFVDGNKRTGLMTAFLYLYVNKHYMAIPIDSVKFTIKVADTRETDEESTNKLIFEIAEWLRKRTATSETEFFINVLKYMVWPSLKLNLLYRFGFKKRAQKIINDWYALDTHGDYVDEAVETSEFLREVMRMAIKELLQVLRTKEREKKKRNSKRETST